jgi:N-acetyl-anhydromuramyl-L-alanine amidase AmpD
MAANESGVIWIPSPFFFPNREGQRPRWLILHGTAGGSSAQGVAAWFQDPTAQVASHYIIGQDGTVVQCVGEADGAYANGIITAGHDPWWDGSVNPNNVTISIEHVKPSTDNSDILTLAQQMASFRLVKDICQRWAIPARAADANGGITGHYSIDPINRKDCPGPYPWNSLFAYLKGPSMIIPQGWTYDQTTQVLIAPNKVSVHLGNAQFILNAPGGWSPANVPLELEHGTPGQSGTTQLFRDCQLAWNQQEGVHYGPLGQEYQVALSQIATGVSQITGKVGAALAQLQQHAALVDQDIAAAQNALTTLPTS